MARTGTETPRLGAFNLVDTHGATIVARTLEAPKEGVADSSLGETLACAPASVEAFSVSVAVPFAGAGTSLGGGHAGEDGEEGADVDHGGLLSVSLSCCRDELAL